MGPTIRSTSLLCLAATLIAGCGGDTATTEPTIRLETAARPAQPGSAALFRFEDLVFQVTRDEEHGLISINGLRNTVAEFCADLGDFDLMQFQIKLHSAGEANALIVDRESPVQILALGPDQFLCRDLQDAPVLYRGTAAFRRLDNNFTPTGTDGGRADSYGWGAQGVLEEVATGRQVHYEEQVRNVINPQTGEQRTLVARIGIR
jgi:hypothetical protein